jgi:nucleotidyltransferase substrate binding protein (TIGR01987 family)
MKKTLCPPGFERTISNLTLAFASLNQFLAEPARTPAVQAGIVQAFEYTFELFWKAFQKVSEANGETTGSPRGALVAAVGMGLIVDADTWLRMLKDRNLTSHTYNQNLASEIVERIEFDYVESFEAALVGLKGID